MSLNCRPGDLAYIKSVPYVGHFVTVVAWAGPGEGTLPDGYPYDNKDKGGWLCEKHVGTFLAPTALGTRRSTRYAVIEDRHLRPIRDQPGTDEMLRIAGLPQDHKQPQEA